MTDNEFPKCRDCIHYDREIDKNDIGKNAGVCRRYPPTVTVIPTQTQQGIGVQPVILLPPVEGNGKGCGEFDDGIYDDDDDIDPEPERAHNAPGKVGKLAS